MAKHYPKGSRFPFNEKVVNRIKSAIVAIGIRDYDGLNLLYVGGTGFVYDPKGYVMTATHVLENCAKVQKEDPNIKKIKSEIIAFRHHYEDGEWRTDLRPFRGIRYLSQQQTENYTVPKKLDVASIKLISSKYDFKYLNIKSPKKFEITEEVSMCGYPGGSYTLSQYRKEHIGKRYSPVIQFGRLSALMPYDSAPEPYGIQTDIIGTGGSSGSPIIDKNEEVVGIAQQVVPGGVDGNAILHEKSLNPQKLPINAMSISGPTYGVSNYVLKPVSENHQKYFDTGKDEKLVINVSLIGEREDPSKRDHHY